MEPLTVEYRLVSDDMETPDLRESRTFSWNVNAEHAHEFIDVYKDSGKRFVVLVRGL